MAQKVQLQSSTKLYSIYLFINDYEYLKRFVHSRLYDRLYNRLQSVNGH